MSASLDLFVGKQGKGGSSPDTSNSSADEPKFQASAMVARSNLPLDLNTKVGPPIPSASRSRLANRFDGSLLRGRPAKCALVDDGRSLWVMCAYHDELGLKPWLLAQVTFEDGLFVHVSHGTFFGEEGVEKQFTLAQGLEWTGGDSIDDYA